MGLGLVGWWRGWTGTSTAVLREHTGLCGALLRGLQGAEVDMRSPLLTKLLTRNGWLI